MTALVGQTDDHDAEARETLMIKVLRQLILFALPPFYFGEYIQTSKNCLMCRM